MRGEEEAVSGRRAESGPIYKDAPSQGQRTPQKKQSSGILPCRESRVSMTSQAERAEAACDNSERSYSAENVFETVVGTKG